MRCAAPVGRRQRARVVFCACPVPVCPHPWWASIANLRCRASPCLAAASPGGAQAGEPERQPLRPAAHGRAAVQVRAARAVPVVGSALAGRQQPLTQSRLPPRLLRGASPHNCCACGLPAPNFHPSHPPRTHTLCLQAAARAARRELRQPQPGGQRAALPSPGGGQPVWGAPAGRRRCCAAPLACLQLASPVCCWHLSSVLTAPRAWYPCVRRRWRQHQPPPSAPGRFDVGLEAAAPSLAKCRRLDLTGCTSLSRLLLPDAAALQSVRWGLEGRPLSPLAGLAPHPAAVRPNQEGLPLQGSTRHLPLV